MLNLLPNFQKKGGLDKTFIFRGGLVGKSGRDDLFEGGGERGCSVLNALNLEE